MYCIYREFKSHREVQAGRREAQRGVGPCASPPSCSLPPTSSPLRDTHYATLRVTLFVTNPHPRPAPQDMLRQLCKKFHDDPQAWLRKVRWHLRQSDAAGARQAMERAMQVLPRHRHVEMATQAALLEFREGAPERGR